MPPIRLVIVFMGTALLTCVILIGMLSYQGRGIPDVLQNIAVGSLASLGTLLVPTRTPPGE